MTINKKSKGHRRKHASCPLCNEEFPKDLGKFLLHLEENHYPGFEYVNGHFLYYQDKKLLSLKIRNAIESFCLKLLMEQAEQFLKGKRGESIKIIDKCSKCRVSKSSFTRYSIDGKFQFLFCLSCKNKLSKTENYIKIIYNPTELGKR